MLKGKRVHSLSGRVEMVECENVSMEWMGKVNGKQASKLTRGKIVKWESEQLS